MKSSDVLFALINGGLFSPRQYQAIVPNVSWGFFSHHEADLVLVTKAGYLTEVEIKVSKSDFESDHLKRKWNHIGDKKNLVKNFYYAMPEDIWNRCDQSKARPEAGVILVRDVNRSPVVVREPKPFQAEKLSDRQIRNLLRLCCLKFWSRFCSTYESKSERLVRHE